MKSVFLFIVPILILSVFFGACKSDSSNSVKPNLKSAESATPGVSKPEIYLYTVDVDKLNIRDQSSKTGKVLAQLPEGAIVEGTGEVSSNKEEVTLRDIPYNEPYFKVKTGGSEGWAYSAALSPIYTGPTAIKPDVAKLTALSTFLKGLNSKELGSGKKAFNYISEHFSTASGSSADAAFIMFRNFMMRMESEGSFYSQTEAMDWSNQDYEDIYSEKFNMDKYPYTKLLKENGFRLETAEGMVFPITDLSKLVDFFSGKVTPPMKEYLIQTLDEQKNSAFSDGGIIVGLDTLIQRAIFWEKFNTQNPYFVLGEETREMERWERITILVGADNTPAFDYETQMQTAEFKKAFADIQQKHAGTKLAKACKELSDLLAAEGGKRSPIVDAWIEKRHLESMGN
jgi:hypothetical protein